MIETILLLLLLLYLYCDQKIYINLETQHLEKQKTITNDISSVPATFTPNRDTRKPGRRDHQVCLLSCKSINHRKPYYVYKITTIHYVGS